MPRLLRRPSTTVIAAAEVTKPLYPHTIPAVAAGMEVVAVEVVSTVEEAVSMAVAVEVAIGDA